MNASQKATLEAFVKRGGGMVILHDSECGPDPDYYATIVGGAKKHGESNSVSGKLTYEVADKSHPIMKDLSDMILDEEAFYRMTWAKGPPIHPLVSVQLPDNPRGGARNAGLWAIRSSQFLGLGDVSSVLCSSRRRDPAANCHNERRRRTWNQRLL